MVFLRPACQTALKRAGHKSQAELDVSNDVIILIVDISTFTVLVAKYLKSEIERRSLEKAEMDQQRNLSNEAVVGLSTKAADDCFHSTVEVLEEIPEALYEYIQG